MTLPEGYPSLNYKDHSSFIEFFKTQAARYQDRMFLRYQDPSAESYDLEFKTLTYGQFDAITSYLASEWSPELEDVKVVAFLGDKTLQCILAKIAILKLGLIHFPMGTNNSDAANIHLLNKTETKFLIASKEFKERAKACTNQLSSVNVKIWDLFDIDQLLALASNKCAKGLCTYPQPKPGSLKDDIAIFQSSGSTGLPKAFYGTNQIAFLSIFFLLEGRKTQVSEPALGVDDVILSTSFGFHGTIWPGTFTSLVFGGQSVILHKHPTAQDMLNTIMKYKVSVINTSPIYLENLAKHLTSKGIDEPVAAALNQIKFCFYMGAPLPLQVGDYLLSKGLNVCNGYGSTEINVFGMANFTKDNKYWYTIKPMDIFSGYYHLEAYGNDLYHLLVRGDSPTMCSNIAAEVGPTGYYPTNDLLREEPPNSGYWQLVKRINDTIVLTDGGKTDPITLENEMRSTSLVRRCMVFGHGKSHTGVLIELNMEQAADLQPHQVNQKVYEAVNAANKIAEQSHSIIAVPEMVFILPPGKKLPVTSKETVARQEVLKQFQKEIDGMYDTFQIEP